jgi:hypothetical protein
LETQRNIKAVAKSRLQNRRIRAIFQPGRTLVEHYIPPDQRKQWKSAPIDTLTFSTGGGEKTFVGHEAGIIANASVAILHGSGFRSPGKPGNDEDALAHLQEHVFNLGTSPRKRAALGQFLIGLDSGKFHTDRGDKGLFGDRPLSGMYGRWNEILIREEPLHYVKVCVNAITAIIHTGGPQVRLSGNPQSVGADTDDGDDTNDYEPVIPAARIGHTTVGAVLRELTKQDYDAIIEELIAWGDGRTARLLPVFLDGKLTFGNASRWESEKAFKADYAFFTYQMNNASSKLHRSVQKRSANVIEWPAAEGACRGKRTIYHPLHNPGVLCSRGITYTLTPCSQYKPGWKDGPFVYLDEDGRSKIDTALPDRFGRE